MTVRDYIDACHATAVERGFWDTERNSGEAIALMVSEVMEGLEAHRKGDKDNLAEEMADTLIRLFDWCGGFNIYPEATDCEMTLEEIVLDGLPAMEFVDTSDKEILERNNFGELLLLLTDDLVTLYFQYSYTANGATEEYKGNSRNQCSIDISNTIYLLLYICKKHDIDVITAIDKKMEYNKTRPYKHGKNY